LKYFNKFFEKNAKFLFLGFQASEEAFSPLKRTFSASKHEIASLISFLGVMFAFLNPDPDFQSGSDAYCVTQLNPD
jgi:hypothetical protein